MLRVSITGITKGFFCVWNRVRVSLNGGWYNWRSLIIRPKPLIIEFIAEKSEIWSLSKWCVNQCKLALASSSDRK